MDSSLNISRTTINSQMPDLLNYDDIKASNESLKAADWRGFQTPDKSLSDSNIVSSFSSFNSPEGAREILEKMTHLTSQVMPKKNQISTNPQSTMIDSTEFLRKKVLMPSEEKSAKSSIDASVRNSVKSILEFANTGKSSDGLPAIVTPRILYDVLNTVVAETQKRPTVEQLIQFVKIIKNDDMGKTPKIYKDEMENKLKQSLNENYSLRNDLNRRENQIHLLEKNLQEMFNVLKEISDKLTSEKRIVDELRNTLEARNDEIEVLKKALMDSERQLDLERQSKKYNKKDVFDEKKENFSEYSQTDDKLISDLLDQNHQLKLQMKQNLETFDKLAENVKNVKNLEKIIEEKTNETQILKKEKQEMLEAVEQLVDSAQKIMESNKGSKQQKLRIFAEMIGSLQSISLSDLQR